MLKLDEALLRMLKVITIEKAMYMKLIWIYMMGGGGGGQGFNSNSSKVTQSSSPNEKNVIDTKRSFGKVNLLSSIITQ